jgi:hypothetical protein
MVQHQKRNQLICWLIHFDCDCPHPWTIEEWIYRLCGGSASLFALFGFIYVMRVLEPEDRNRFKLLAGMLPKPMYGPEISFCRC